MQAVKQPVILEGFDHREALKMLLLLDEVWLMLFVALLILLLYIYYIKLRSRHQSCSIKKHVLRNFVKFPGKQA